MTQGETGTPLRLPQQEWVSKILVLPFQLQNSDARGPCGAAPQGRAPSFGGGGEGLRSRGRAARPPGSGQWEPVVPGAGEAGELGFYSRTANHHQLGSLKQHTSSLRFCGLSGSALSSVQGLAKLQSRCQRNGVFSRMLEWGRVCIWASSGCHRLYFFTTVYLRPDFLLAVGQRPPSGRGGGFLNVAAHSVKPVREPTSVCW